MGVLLSFIPEKDLFWGGIVVALLIGFGFFVHHERSLGAAHEVAALKISSDKLVAAAAKQVQETASNYAATVAALQEKTDATLKADAVQHDSDAQRLREYNAYRSEHPSLGSAASSPGSQNQGTSGPAESYRLLDTLEPVAVGLADADRDLSVELKACMADRDALTGK
jgi:hypothetical protein